MRVTVRWLAPPIRGRPPRDDIGLRHPERGPVVRYRSRNKGRGIGSLDRLCVLQVDREQLVIRIRLRMNIAVLHVPPDRFVIEAPDVHPALIPGTVTRYQIAYPILL